MLPVVTLLPALAAGCAVVVAATAVAAAGCRWSSSAPRRRGRPERNGQIWYARPRAAPSRAIRPVPCYSSWRSVC
jgi:hypothetical protein